MDMLCIGNNLFDQEQEMAGIADHLEQCLQDGRLNRAAVEPSIERVRQRKALLS
jgi:beta-N-acetylhexosaminidase